MLLIGWNKFPLSHDHDQIWVMTCHQNGISLLIPQMSFQGKTSVHVINLLSAVFSGLWLRSQDRRGTKRESPPQSQANSTCTMYLFSSKKVMHDSFTLAKGAASYFFLWADAFSSCILLAYSTSIIFSMKIRHCSHSKNITGVPWD